jgi:hypothetical protein
VAEGLGTSVLKTIGITGRVSSFQLSDHSKGMTGWNSIPPPYL